MTSASSSPPSKDSPDPLKMEFDPEEDKHILQEEEKARQVNLQKEARKAAALKRKKKTKVVESKFERDLKAKQLDNLLRQSAAFSDIITKKTEVLGRVGSGFDGKALGEHNLVMDKQPDSLINGQMRDYQLEGLTWMLEICNQGLSGILADEMGLGKR